MSLTCKNDILDIGVVIGGRTAARHLDGRCGVAARYAVAHDGDGLGSELHGDVGRLDAIRNVCVRRIASGGDDQLNGRFEGADDSDLIGDEGGSDDWLGLPRAHRVGRVRSMVEHDHFGIDVRGGYGGLVSFEGVDERDVEQPPPVVLEADGPRVVSSGEFVR